MIPPKWKFQDGSVMPGRGGEVPDQSHEVANVFKTKKIRQGMGDTSDNRMTGNRK